jgi:cytochrome c-type biogenesis protein CcsB
LNSGHLPLSNLYESLIFLTWSITIIQILLEKTSGFDFLGVLLCPLALLIFGFATFSLPIELQNRSPLVPALQSNWLLMHVSIMILSYATLLCGCILSITYLFITEYKFKNINLFSIFNRKSISLKPESLEGTKSLARIDLQKTSFFEAQNATDFRSKSTQNQLVPPTLKSEDQNDQSLRLSALVFDKKKYDMFSSPDLKNSFQIKLDNVSYRMIGIGFAFLTIGILSGAVWANETWGSYWSWDPKETWAFITWLIFAIYLHSRLNYAWQGKKPALVASIGFIVVWICYLGVNLVGKGLHSYGWIQFS